MPETLRDAITACALGPVETEGPTHCWRLRFDDDFMGFRGHFPGHPVLPAFVQLLLAQGALTRRTGRGWTLERIKRAKFMQVVSPGQTVLVTWTERTTDGALEGRFDLSVAGRPVARFTAGFVPEEPADA